MVSVMTPREIVHELDKHIVGQGAAKRAVAIALRNRWRRMQVTADLRAEITPKNILMIGPTGVGKTEIARRLARLAGAPFIKVEATKFTEVGYVGRDVESIVRDLVENAVSMVRQDAMRRVTGAAEDAAEDRVLDALLPRARGTGTEDPSVDSTRQKMRAKLRQGDLDDREIDIQVQAMPSGVEIMAPPGMEDMTSQLRSMFQNLAGERTRTRRLKVRDALRVLREEEAARLVNDEEVKQAAVEAVEQNGIVFLDEIDKVCRRGEHHTGGDVSREGVQRDLLPLVEGCTVSTKYGMVDTSHILFIASGAFHLAKPSDLIPELQGRLPILVRQYQALLATEGLELSFTDDGVARLAEVAWQVNERTENIGARRLHTVMERLLEGISYQAPDRSGEAVRVDGDYVDEHLAGLARDEDLSRYIL